jgi:hypothetical protein
MQGLWYNIFCSQKFNLLVFIIGIADHSGDAQDGVTKEKEKSQKPHSSTKQISL